MQNIIAILGLGAALGLSACGQQIPNRYDAPRHDYLNQNYLKGWAAGKMYLQKHGDPDDKAAVGLMWVMLKKEQGGHLTIEQLRQGWRMAVRQDYWEDHYNSNSLYNFDAISKAADLYADGWVDAALGEDEPRVGK